jgi:glycerol-3-phosphate dehydrogenase (NAD(P)+)
VGGPSKANEVARGLPTAVIYGSLDAEAVEFAREVFATPRYRIEPTDDITGLEVVAAMKNAYAIALGMADGLEQRTGLPHHNLRAALFPRAVTEMGLLARAFGGRAETVFGLAGAGDLQVTITSGRNRLLGERIGRGNSPAEAVQTLATGGTTVEGYRAATFGYRFYRQAVDAGVLAEGSLPLLDALWRVLYCDAEPATALWGAV